MSSRIKLKYTFYDFKIEVHLIGILFNIIIADARNHEPEICQRLLVICPVARPLFALGEGSLSA
jgi:hypothetical protein